MKSKSLKTTPEFASYIEWATQALAEQAGVTGATHTRQQCAEWVRENLASIMEKAFARMRYIAESMTTDAPDDAAKAIMEVMGIRVWERANVAAIRRKCRAAEENAMAKA